MAESVVLPLLTEVAKPMVKVVASRVTKELPVIVGFERELSNLQEKIQIIAGIVDSITAVPNPGVEPWLRKVMRILRNAENMMDELAYEKHRWLVMKRRPNKTTRLVVLPLKRLSSRCKMGRWIRKINSDIEAVKNEARFINDFTGALVHSASSSQPAARNTDNDRVLRQAMLRRNVDTSLFVGRDSDVATVVDKLLNSCSQDAHENICQNRLSVVAIVGIGELKKLMPKLSELIYDHESQPVVEQLCGCSRRHNTAAAAGWPAEDPVRYPFGETEVVCVILLCI